jgi:molybdate transport system ATP-binding protein
MITVSLVDKRQPSLDVEFSCAAGELIALVGPSGAGKSTVLRCIAGLHTAQAGAVSINNKDWFSSDHKLNLSPQQRRVGFVFQDYALFPHLTVADNVQLAQSNAKDTQLTNSLLAKVNLSGLEHRYPHQLSGGQQQRVAIARALAREPDVLLLDEPFSAVDKVTRRKLYLELNSLRRDLAMPIILVTHDLDEAAMLADTMVVIHHGKTLQQGTPAQVLHQPNTIAVAKLVDVRNLFNADLIRHDNKAQLHWQGTRITLSERQIEQDRTVNWTISPSKVILHQRVRPSRGERENPINGHIIELLTLRGITTVLLAVEGVENCIIQMDISEHVASRNDLKVGEMITVSLLASAIHLIEK